MTPSQCSDTFHGDVESDFGNGKSYEWLRDAVLHAFNPPDDDAAEESICERAIFDAADFIAEHPCECVRMCVIGSAPLRPHSISA